jgi:hypothetical protein
LCRLVNVCKEKAIFVTEQVKKHVLQPVFRNNRKFFAHFGQNDAKNRQCKQLFEKLSIFVVQNFNGMLRSFFSLLLLILFASCQSKSKPVVNVSENVIVPAFSADSAYAYIANQVDFGPRVPNTKAHADCSDYLSNKLRAFGALVYEQKSVLIAFDGTKLNAVNIIGAFNPGSKNRILLFAHWDSRPWADHDPNPANRRKPVIGANDGASGVGVLLEVARVIGQNNPAVGIDIIFFDAEDYGAPQDYAGNHEDSWCLGSQYWSKNPHVEQYNAKYGILLDMVGAGDATFYRESFSEYYAPQIVDKIWNTAATLGFERYFINKSGGAVTDDHVYVNKIAGIPSANIIHYSTENQKGFGDFWHTVNDDMSVIDKNTLMAVGTTLLKVIYSEK